MGRKVGSSVAALFSLTIIDSDLAKGGGCRETSPKAAKIQYQIRRLTLAASSFPSFPNTDRAEGPHTHKHDGMRILWVDGFTGSNTYGASVLDAFARSSALWKHGDLSQQRIHYHHETSVSISEAVSISCAKARRERPYRDRY